MHDKKSIQPKTWFEELKDQMSGYIEDWVRDPVLERRIDQAQRDHEKTAAFIHKMNERLASYDSSNNTQAGSSKMAK